MKKFLSVLAVALMLGASVAYADDAATAAAAPTPVKKAAHHKVMHKKVVHKKVVKTTTETSAPVETPVAK